ncbi:MAG TPA: MBOAT family O-acyltransferase, partial [Acidisarcina sp.]
ADKLALVAAPAFDYVAYRSPLEAWVGVVCYSLQLYFDFSGYSDMAIGLARMFSIKFPFNFNSPYKAASIIDFWARWHMTLTRYLTLYLYNPISMSVNRRRLAAGKKVSRKAQKTIPGFLSMIAWPTMITMFLAGVWHGAGTQFLIFGLLHGIFITINHAWRNFKERPAADAPVPVWRHAGSVLLTYMCVLLGQIFFRANSVHDAMTMLASMTGIRHLPMSRTIPAIGYWPLVLLPFVWFLPNTQQIFKQIGNTNVSRFWQRLTYSPTWGWTVSMSLLFVVAVLYASDTATFLYFQF